MIQSNKYPAYYKMFDLFGVTRVRTSMEWGKHFMIDFLNKLGRGWGRDPYWQYDDFDNWADIPLGDISQDGGGPRRSKVPRFHGHSSHRCGVDVDIFVIAKDGVSRKNVAYGQQSFDLARTKLLGRAILTNGGSDLEKIFIGGTDMVEFMQDESKKLGIPQGVIHPDSSGMHHNHFHVRLKNKDGDKMCF